MTFVLRPDKVYVSFYCLFIFKFEIIGLGGKENFRIINPRTIPYGGFLVTRAAFKLLRMWKFTVTLYIMYFFRESLPQGQGIHRRNGYSGVNYQLLD
jgi:hypothetical protein